MLEAEKKVRRVLGYKDLAQLAVAVERDLADSELTKPEEVQTLVTV